MKPHEILGIPPNSSKEDATKAWKNKLKTCHPDLHQDEKAKKKAEEETKILNKSYDEFVNPKQPQFQQSNPFQQQGFQFNFGNIFDQIHRQHQHFQSQVQIQQDVNVSLVDYLKKTDLEVDVPQIQKKIRLPFPDTFVSGKIYQIRISEDKSKNQGIIILNLKLNLVVSDITEEQRKKLIGVLTEIKT